MTRVIATNWRSMNTALGEFPRASFQGVAQHYLTDDIRTKCVAMKIPATISHTDNKISDIRRLCYSETYGQSTVLGKVLMIPLTLETFM